MAYRSRPAARVDPGLGARMADLAAVLLHCFEPLSREGGKQRIVHADCKPSQFLIDGTKVGLLDFDHAGMADPALDVGTFMASLRQLGCRRSPKARRPTVSNMDRWMCLERSFLDSYCRSTDVDDDFRQRAVWYEAFALLRKAQRAFARSFRRAAFEVRWRALTLPQGAPAPVCARPGGARSRGGLARGFRRPCRWPAP